MQLNSHQDEKLSRTSFHGGGGGGGDDDDDYKCSVWCSQATSHTIFAVCDHTKICILKYMQHRMFLGDSIFQQQVIHVFTFTLVINARGGGTLPC